MAQCYLLTPLSPCGTPGWHSRCRGTLPSALCSAIWSIWKEPSTFCLPFLPGHFCHPSPHKQNRTVHRVAVPPEAGVELWKGLDEASVQLSPRVQKLDPARSKCWQLPCWMGCPDVVPCSLAPATPLLWSVARHHIRAMLKFLG